MSTWYKLLWKLPHRPVVTTIVWRVVSLGHITVTWGTLVPAMSLGIVRTISSVERHGTGLLIYLKVSTNIMVEQGVKLSFWICLEVGLGKHGLQLSDVG